MMKNLLLNNEEVTTSSLPLRPEGLTCIVVDCNQQPSPISQIQAENQDVTIVPSPCDHNFDLVNDLKDHDNCDARKKDEMTINNSGTNNYDATLKLILPLKIPHQDGIHLSKSDHRNVMDDDIEIICTKETSTMIGLDSPIDSKTEENMVGSSQKVSSDKDRITHLQTNTQLEDNGDICFNPSTGSSGSSDESFSSDDDSLSSMSDVLSSKQKQYPDSPSSSSSSSPDSSSSSSSPSSCAESSSFPFT